MQVATTQHWKLIKTVTETPIHLSPVAPHLALPSAPGERLPYFLRAQVGSERISSTRGRTWGSAAS